MLFGSLTHLHAGAGQTQASQCPEDAPRINLDISRWRRRGWHSRAWGWEVGGKRQRSEEALVKSTSVCVPGKEEQSERRSAPLEKEPGIEARRARLRAARPAGCPFGVYLFNIAY